VLPDEIPEVELSTRLIGFSNFAQVARYKDNTFSEHYFFAADSNFFDVLPFKLLKGDPNHVLRHPNTIVLTAATAARYFGEEDPMGKVIEVAGQNQSVVGVMENVPENSHLKFDALTPALGVNFLQQPNFYIAGTYTYVKLAEGTDPKTVDQKIPPLVEKYAAGQIERDLGVSYKKYIQDGNGYRYFLQSLKDIHLHSQRSNEIQANGNVIVVNALFFISLLILVIAGINFVNLATARSTERAKEVGVRKVLGSRKKQLITQFLSESLLICTVSMFLAVAIIQLSIDFFQNIAKVPLSFNLLESPWTLVMLLIITLCLGLFAGLYPAFYISALKPVQVLKGKFQSSSRGSALRNGLVIFQFTISIILISATLVVYDQLNYVQTKSLGFEKENLLLINHNSQGKQSAPLQNEIRKLPGVTQVGGSNTMPGGYFYALQYRLPGASEVYTPKGFVADDNLVATLNLEVLEGRAFSEEFNDSLSLIINERAARVMKLDNPVGTVLVNNVNPETAVSYTIVGVVKDFNFESLHTEITPLVIGSTEGQFNFQSVLMVRLNTSDLPQTVSAIEKKWKTLVPNDPFIYSFMDNRLDNLYTNEKSSSALLTVFTVIALIIACVGLFGLAAYMVNQRTKEIGVRKVLGASMFSIINLVSKDFAKLVLVSFVLGTPIAWFLMNRWLGGFAYRITLSPLSFAIAGVSVLLFTLMTISYKALSAAAINPVDTLKDE
jgi:putative ABC transport system permease protein